MDAIRLKSCALILAAIVAAPLHASEASPVAVLWEAPACEYRKLGSVAIEAGKRVYGHTTENATAVSYTNAFMRLAAAAEDHGGNAVIIRWHQATYFTRFGTRSRTPVHLQLRGATIRIDGDAAGCDLMVVDPEEFAKRAKRGDPMTVAPGDAYSDD